MALRVLVAPDKFKGSLDAAAVAEALAAGIADAVPDATCVRIPMADGGDGTVDAFVATGAVARVVRVTGPRGTPVDARYARDGDTAIVEMAAASGLVLAGESLEPRRATTRGTGEVLRDALDAGAKRIVLGIGGSATTDGGAGALAALGARFLDGADHELEPIPEALAAVARIDLSQLDPRLRGVEIAIACDVDNPLLGEQGAAAVYGPQKGASPEDVTFLDGVLARLADAMSQGDGARPARSGRRGRGRWPRLGARRCLRREARARRRADRARSRTAGCARGRRLVLHGRRLHRRADAARQGGRRHRRDRARRRGPGRRLRRPRRPRSGARAPRAWRGLRAGPRGARDAR